MGVLRKNITFVKDMEIKSIIHKLLTATPNELGDVIDKINIVIINNIFRIIILTFLTLT